MSERPEATAPRAARACLADDPTLFDDAGDVLVLAFNDPDDKVNKLTTRLMNSIETFLTGLNERARRADSTIKGLVITSHKPGVFMAGADIAEIEGITDPREGQEKARRGQKIFDLLESLPIPTICAVNGVCVGGGYELAMSCTRILVAEDPKVQIGLPEVRLGILPGFGGTQRLARRAGLRTALDMILAGKTLDAHRALKAGLVDAVVPSPLLEEQAFMEARRLWPLRAAVAGRPRSHSAARRAPITARLTEFVLERNPIGRGFVASRARKALEARVSRAHYPAPYEALESILAGFRLPEEQAYENEARRLGEMIVTPTCKNLVFLFKAQSAAKKDTAGVDVSGRRREVGKVGILGAGVMGAGIAAVVAANEIPVRLKDVSWQVLARGLGSIASGWRSLLERKRIDRRELEKRMSRVSPTTGWGGFSTCDLVIEAVLERIDVKWQVLAEAESVMRDEALFATNTSSLRVGEIASKARRPERVIGLHFFNPVAKMPLVEVVAGPRTDPAAIATAVAFVDRIGKVPVVVRDGPGFLVNRLLVPYLGEAIVLAENGADLEAIDRTAVAWGMPMGPFRLLDEIGLDIARHAAAEMAAALPARAAPTNGSLDRMVAAGRLGVKSGLGFYRYPASPSKEKPAVEGGSVAIVNGGSGLSDSRAAAMPFGPVVSGAEELMDLLVFPVINEAAQCLQEGIARCPRDVDLAMVMGTGFPPFRGGPLRYADSLGAAEVCGRLESLSAKFGERLAPVGSLRGIVRSGGLVRA